jgi:pimeloyl-ACP methyl ester carboxylesterase
VIERFVHERPIFVGSSMGGWIGLLVARHLMDKRPQIAPVGIVLIAPAVDMTERLMWDRFPEDLRKSVQETGVYHRPSAYSDDPYPITWKLIEDGRKHILLDQPIQTGCPVHILQGMEDPDVPWNHALQLVEHLPGDSVSLTLIKDGDHRLSRREDIERLIAAVEAIA